MKSVIFKLCSVSLLVLLAAQSASAGDVVVISNPGTTISAGEVKDVFLGEKQFAGSIKLIPVDNSAAQGAFLSKFIEMDTAKYNGIWTKKSFRDGLTPPPVKTSDAEVVEYVKRTPGAVGYVGGNPSGVNIVK
ncbi:MAG: phosphate ABC transporter substrate-binding protein [Nitrosomonadales bacterium]|nr:phosphate ABC transporter substrate-binding protein [Nitrosomonadales bacterium]